MEEQLRYPVTTNISFLPGHQKQEPSQLCKLLSQPVGYIFDGNRGPTIEKQNLFPTKWGVVRNACEEKCCHGVPDLFSPHGMECFYTAPTLGGCFSNYQRCQFHLRSKNRLYICFLISPHVITETPFFMIQKNANTAQRIHFKSSQKVQLRMKAEETLQSEDGWTSAGMEGVWVCLEGSFFVVV